MPVHVFTVADMSCGNCVKHITSALNELDPQARLDINLDDKRVEVSTERTQADIIQALDEAGYDAVPR